MLLFNIMKAETIVLSFDTANLSFPISCNEPWEENGIPMYVKPLNADNCGFFGFGNGSIILAPAKIYFDLSSLGTINSIEADVGDNCGFGCTKAIMYFGYNVVDTIENSVIGAETLIYNNSDNKLIDALCISGGEGSLNEVRIDYTPKAANEEKIVLNFDEADPAFPANCGDTWMEEEISMQITKVTQFSYCTFFVTPANNIFLAQGRVTLDLSNLGIINQIAIDVIDNCNFGFGWKYRLAKTN